MSSNNGRSRKCRFCENQAADEKTMVAMTGLCNDCYRARAPVMLLKVIPGLEIRLSLSGDADGRWLLLDQEQLTTYRQGKIMQTQQVEPEILQKCQVHKLIGLWQTLFTQPLLSLEEPLAPPEPPTPKLEIPE